MPTQIEIGVGQEMVMLIIANGGIDRFETLHDTHRQAQFRVHAGESQTSFGMIWEALNQADQNV